MTLSSRAERLLRDQKLTADQYAAAAERERAVVVTAGAGSGKTRTLVARYLGLLSDGYTPQSLVAITFTEKAAREMRARIRRELRAQVRSSRDPGERAFWQGLEQNIDAARIGTIHSLCGEILRAHPAEAGVDPQFSVMEEGLASIARADAVETVLAAAMDDAELVGIFEVIRSRTLDDMLKRMLAQRLDTAAAFEIKADGRAILLTQLAAFVRHPVVQDAVHQLREMAVGGTLSADTTPKGEEQVQAFLDSWQEVESFLEAGDLQGVMAGLQRIRNAVLNRIVGKNGSFSKTALNDLRDGALDPMVFKWLGRNEAVDAELEARMTMVTPLLRQLFEMAVGYYQSDLRQQQALDFDDLEAGALMLLRGERTAEKWQSAVQAVLVDEFQDTNQRQREIVERIVGSEAGKLFIVGDARQSIYRFRGADVTVFYEVQAEIGRQDGRLLDLDLTFRTHAPLLFAMGDLLAVLMGIEKDPEKPYEVPYTPLQPERSVPGDASLPPHLEMVIGVGENADEGRSTAAAALAQRLLELKAEGQIRAWQEVVILCRASSAFPDHEAALEAAQIPYVTVAGSGFYERPEVRDLLNLLRAQADPWDDLAVTGLLRSPAVGMSDLGITQLRWLDGADTPRALHKALEMDLTVLTDKDRAAARRASDLFAKLQPEVGLISVAEVLQRLVEETNYRALLAGSTERTWRNVDKLVQDAYASGLFSVHAYLEYLEQIRDVGAREGEAPGEAEQAVQLMTIHKAKGLEFPIVVLADAARLKYISKAAWLQTAETGVAFKSDGLDYQPALFRLARYLDQAREDAEDRRLLYVALTRAQEKCLINGHVTQKDDRTGVKGWLKEMLEATALDPAGLVNDPPAAPIGLPGGEALRIRVVRDAPVFAPAEAVPVVPMPAGDAGDLWRRLPVALLEEKVVVRVPRVLPDPQEVPQYIVGKLLHRALQVWQFPENEGEAGFLYRAALAYGLVDTQPRVEAVQRVLTYLKRLKGEQLYEEISLAEERHHEVPYALADLPDAETGRLDILYRTNGSWRIVDFKTDRLARLDDLEDRRRKLYRDQLERYSEAVARQLGSRPQASICLLDVAGGVLVVPLEDLRGQGE